MDELKVGQRRFWLDNHWKFAIASIIEDGRRCFVIYDGTDGDSWLYDAQYVLENSKPETKLHKLLEGIE